MVVHPIGYPVNYDELKKFKKEFNLTVIEDAADALGTYYKKKHAGTFGKFGALSFNGNKIITCGSGGAILTQDKNLAKKAKKIVEVSKIPHKFKFFHNEIGYNYRMSNIQAAIGLSQIKRIKKILLDKKRILKFYDDKFKDNKYFTLLKENKNETFNYWLQTILVNKKFSNHISKVLEELYSKKFFLRIGWELMPTLKHLKKFQSMNITVAKDVQRRIIHLPSSSFLAKKI